MSYRDSFSERRRVETTTDTVCFPPLALPSARQERINYNGHFGNRVGGWNCLWGKLNIIRVNINIGLNSTVSRIYLDEGDLRWQRKDILTFIDTIISSSLQGLELIAWVTETFKIISLYKTWLSIQVTWYSTDWVPVKNRGIGQLKGEIPHEYWLYLSRPPHAQHFSDFRWGFPFIFPHLR